MSKSPRTCTLVTLLQLGLLALSPGRTEAAELRIQEIVAARPTTEASRSALIGAARIFYQFWNSGDERGLKKAISPRFVDRTLPPGRPQGPDGPAFASRHFRAAVPDLTVTVEKMIVDDPYVTVHMRFEGHFTGRFGEVRGRGQPVAFIATDLLKIQDGLITDNWHIEDNLTLLQQMGIVPAS